MDGDRAGTQSWTLVQGFAADPAFVATGPRPLSSTGASSRATPRRRFWCRRPPSRRTCSKRTSRIQFTRPCTFFKTRTPLLVSGARVVRKKKESSLRNDSSKQPSGATSVRDLDKERLCRGSGGRRPTAIPWGGVRREIEKDKNTRKPCESKKRRREGVPPGHDVALPHRQPREGSHAHSPLPRGRSPTRAPTRSLALGLRRPQFAHLRAQN